MSLMMYMFTAKCSRVPLGAIVIQIIIDHLQVLILSPITELSEY